ncbi:MAG: Hsp33 family molecular chaperone HslO [Clostridia bacterium]|jgi:molecular chaperone Hsp33|nr:Hsp33 family molecular chaperone HslO [Clostridia bacterium]
MDYVVRATAAKGQVRAFAVDLTETVREAAKLHDLFPLASAALGRTMVAAVMIAADMKSADNSVSIIIKGGGPLGNIIVTAKANGTVKGYVDNPYVDLPLNKYGKLDVRAGVGIDGMLTVIKDLGLKEPYAGQIELVSGEIAEDLAHYFWSSEQQPSVIALGVLVNPDSTIRAAGGYIVQPLPGADDQIIDKLEKVVGQAAPITTMIDQGMRPEDVLDTILGDMDLRLNDRLDYKFLCDCSRERLEGLVLSLGKQEIEDIIKKEGKAEMICHYCSSKYLFGRDDLNRLLDLAK